MSDDFWYPYGDRNLAGQIWYCLPLYERVALQQAARERFVLLREFVLVEIIDVSFLPLGNKFGRRRRDAFRAAYGFPVVKFEVEGVELDAYAVREIVWLEWVRDATLEGWIDPFDVNSQCALTDPRRYEEGQSVTE